MSDSGEDLDELRAELMDELDTIEERLELIDPRGNEVRRLRAKLLKLQAEFVDVEERFGENAIPEERARLEEIIRSF